MCARCTVERGGGDLHAIIFDNGMNAMLARVIDSNGANAVVQALHGFVAYDKQDPLVGRAIENYGEFSEGVVKLLRQLCHEGNIVVEVGAKNGAHSLALSTLVGPSGRVYAIEPDRSQFQLLCATVALNGVDNVECYQLAAAEGTENGSLATTPQVSLDQLLNLQAVRLLKIDADGQEYSVLSGAMRLIRQHQPMLFVSNMHVASSRRLIQLFHSLDYAVLWHLAPLFRKDNEAGNPENLFQGEIVVHLFGYPKSRPLALGGFTQATVSDFNPIQLSQWLSLRQAGDMEQADALCGELNRTAPRHELVETLLALGTFAFQEERFSAAEWFLTWLRQIDTGSWSAQFAAAAVTERLAGAAAATQQFRQFISEHPVYCYHESPNPRALRLATLLTSGEKAIRFTVSGYKLPAGNTDTHHLTWRKDRTLGSLFVDGLAPEHLDGWQLLMNAVSDADLYRDDLARLAALLQNCDRPIINHPIQTAANTRDVLSLKLQDNPQFLVPKTIRVEPVAYGQPLVDRVEQAQLRYPILIRPAGSQTGEGLDRVEDEAQLEAYRAAATSIYLTEFYDLRATDGFYRKYRCWYIGDQIVPNHLFIHSNWKVHGTSRAKTMVRHAWMCQEEQQFIHDLGGPRRESIVRLMDQAKEATGLDYVGVDFAFDQQGRPVLFEANATMRSYYPEWARSFPYTRSVLSRHVGAFQRLLAQKANSN